MCDMCEKKVDRVFTDSWTGMSICAFCLDAVSRSVVGHSEAS